MNIPNSFLIEEVKYGFYIPAAVKQAWAAQMTVLSEIDRICRKYDIHYFADWGTLIGASRHAGYIPWDDDLDIVMKRPDYLKFIEVSESEFSEGFFLQRYTNVDDPTEWLFMGKVVGRNNICFEKDHLRKFANFPYIACVDIFVLDYAYRDEEKEKERNEKCLYLMAMADGITSGKYKGNEIDIMLQYIKKTWGLSLKRYYEPITMGRYLYGCMEEIFAEVPEKEADFLIQIFPWGLKGVAKKYPKEYYDTPLYLPFEFTYMPVPKAYDRMLRQRYGDYAKIYKNGGAHDYPFFEEAKRRFAELLDFELPSYKVTKEELEAYPVRTKDSGNEASDAERIVLFVLPYARDMHCLKEIIYKEASRGAVLLFLPTPYYFKDYDEDVREVCCENDAIVDEVVKLDEALAGQGIEAQIEILNPEDTSIEGIMSVRPDCIYFTNPYDQWDVNVSIAPEYYTANLRACTDELVYVSPYDTDDFTKENEREYKNLKYYLPMPGVVRSDRVLVKTAALRDVWIQYMMEICRNFGENIWERKISVCGEFIGIFKGDERLVSFGEKDGLSEEAKEGIATIRKKKVLYLTSVGCLHEYADEALKKVESVMRYLRKHPKA